MTPFVHQHSHTDYSLLDGASEISQLMDLVVEHCNYMGGTSFR